MSGVGVNPNGPRYGRNGLRIAPGMIRRALNSAYRQIGTPYVWGGSSPGGFDCSGLVYWAYRNAGYTGIGRTTYDQIKQGIQVGIHNLHPGDIVFPEAGHEGLYVGNGMVLQAPHTGTDVGLIPLSQFGFMTARRLIGGGGGIIPPRGIGGQSASGLPVPHQDPQMRQPNYQAQWQQFQQQTVAAQQKLAQQFQQSQAAMMKQMQQQAAQARQQNLAASVAAQAQARVQSAQAAQQMVSAGGSPSVSAATPAQALYDQRKAANDSVRATALRRAGIG